MNTHVDLLVIGFGKGGKMAAVKAAKAGWKVALLEESPRMYGGTCINVGCVPTKILIHDALVHAAAGRRLGEDPARAFLAAVGRKNTLTGAINKKNLAMVEGAPDAEVITGHARFTGENSVEVTLAEGGVRTLTADHVIVNTGATPVIPPIPGVAEGLARTSGARVLTTEAVQDLEALPGSLTILGGGAIGIEFATFFALLGTRVTILEAADRLLPREDDDTAASLVARLGQLGVEIRTGVRVESVEVADTSVTVSGSDGHGALGLEADHLLLATGRRPNTEGLDCAAAGIELTERSAIKVDEHLRSTNPRVHALGDVNGGPQFTYISLDDLRIWADDVLVPAEAREGRTQRTNTDRMAVPTTIFTHPPFSRVGLTEREAREAGHRVRIVSRAVADLGATPRARIDDCPEGMVKFVIDEETDAILGAAIFMVDSTEVINLVALAMRSGIPAAALANGIWNHPSATEVLNEVLS